MARASFIGSEIRGQIVEVLLPKWKEGSDRGHSYLKTRKRHITLKARTVCLQVGEHNNIRVGVVDLAMPDDVSDCLTTASEEDELVVRVFQRYSGSEELVLIKNARRIRQSINICADFVRIIPPLDEKPYLEGFTVVSEINARCTQIGDKNNIAINPVGFRNVFDSTKPILRVLRSPTKPTSVLRDAQDLPNLDKDHLVVLEVCENRCTARALEYSFGQSSFLATSKKTKDYYDVKVTVTEGTRNGKNEIRDGVLFVRDASFDILQGVAGFWFRFQIPSKRYIITFSLWKKRTGTQSSKQLDEIHITVDTSDQNSAPHTRNKRQRLICEETPLPSRTHDKPTLLEVQCHVAENEQKFSPNTISEQTSHPDHFVTSQTSLPGQQQMTGETSKRTPPRRKRKQKYLPKRESEETSLPGQSHQIASEETFLPAEVTGFFEQSLQIMEILRDLRDDGKWDEFNRMAEQLLKKYATNIDLQIAIILEQGMAACYQNELKSAEEFIKKAISKVSHASTNLVSLCKGRGSYSLAGIHRRDKMALGKARTCIDLAKKHLNSRASILDRVYLAYEEGCLLLEQAHKSFMAKESKRCFDRCIEISSLGLKESANNLLSRMHDMALMKKTMLLLDSFTKSGRESRSVKEEALLEAKHCLDSLKSNFAEMPKIAQVQYHLVRSDQYFREQRLVDASKHAQIAFDLSHQYHFDTLDAAEVRLNFVNKLRNSS